MQGLIPIFGSVPLSLDDSVVINFFRLVGISAQKLFHCSNDASITGIGIVPLLCFCWIIGNGSA